MKKIKIEFFHDVICSFCFPMSARMRKISAKLADLDIVHRSFALGWQPEDFIAMFGSREAVKPEVLHHWAAANANDDEHRFNIRGIEKESFLFPLSKPGLIAAKAAGIIGGEAMYWDAFDAIQRKLFVENRNVEDFAVLKEAVGEVGVPIEEWEYKFYDPRTEQAVQEDLKLASAYGVHSVPTLVVDGKYLLSGAQSEEQIIKSIKSIIENDPTYSAPDEGAACNLENGAWKCE